MEPNTLKMITVVTKATIVTFHIDTSDVDIWTEHEGLLIFTKLSGNDISFVKENVIYIDEQNVADNSGSVSTT